MTASAIHLDANRWWPRITTNLTPSGDSLDSTPSALISADLGGAERAWSFVDTLMPFLLRPKQLEAMQGIERRATKSVDIEAQDFDRDSDPVANSNPVTSAILWFLRGEKQAKDQALAGAIAEYLKSVRQIDSGQLVGLSVIMTLPSDLRILPFLYTAKNSSFVAEFLREDTRITCVFREGYAHLMQNIGGEFGDDVFEGESFDLDRISACLRNYIMSSEKSGALETKRAANREV